MHTVFAIAVITFKEGIRHRVLFGALVLAAFLLFFSVLASGLFMRDGLKVLLDICLSSVSIGGLLVPFFLTIDLLARDIETRTIYTILARSVSRSDYILGKFLGLAILTAAIMAIFTLTTFVSIWLASTLYPSHFLENLAFIPILLSVLSSFMSVLVLTSTVILWCSLTTSSFLATLLTLSTYAIGHSAEDMVRFISAKISGVAISPIIEQIVNITMYVFPNLATFDLKQQAAYGIVISGSHLLFLGVYTTGYSALMLILAITALSKRDLP